MDFISYALEQIDFAWILIQILVVPIAIGLCAQVIPIPTALVMIMVIKLQFSKADFMVGAYHFTGDPDLLKSRTGCYIDAAIHAIVTIAVFVGLIYLNIDSGSVCRDFTGYLPGMLPSLMQHFAACPKLIP